MGRKIGLTSLFYKTRFTRPSPSPLSSSSSSSWAWPSCKHPRTLSFRAEDSSELCFTNWSAMEFESFPTVCEATGTKTLEAIMRGLRADRLFFEPTGSTSSVVEVAAETESVPFDGSVAMEMDPKDPYWDFKVSMEEMVVAHGLKDSGWLPEMLGWYLRMNGKGAHGFMLERL